jgi:quinone-reactive Ni/Fe-hydrogenase large subunit
MKIGESIGGSRYTKDGSGNYPDGSPFKHPWDGETNPDPNLEYSWLKSPRYDIGGDNYQPFEVGPLARQVVQGNYFAGVLNALGYPIAPVWAQNGPDCTGGTPLDALGVALAGVYSNIPLVTGGPNLSGVAYNGDSTLDRIAARAVETLLIAKLMNKYLNQLQNTMSGGYGASGCTDPDVPVSGTETKGYGMTEASRGALSHWIKMQSGEVTRYQAIVPTTWNANPRDVNGTPGPAEMSLMNNGGLWVANPQEAIEVTRVTHSYDFCIACAVHLISPKGEVITVDVPALP